MRSSTRKGFSLIELLMAIAIMVAVTSIVVLNRNKTGEGASLKNNADLVSLAVRQAQVNSISVRESSTGSQNFDHGYGVEFTLNNSGSYISFIDTNGNGTADGAGETQTTNTLTNSNTISGLCYVPTSGAEVCGQQKVDITFLRPSTTAHLYVNGVGNLPIQAVKINLVSSASSLTRSIYVYTTGQVAVQ